MYEKSKFHHWLFRGSFSQEAFDAIRGGGQRKLMGTRANSTLSLSSTTKTFTAAPE